MAPRTYAMSWQIGDGPREAGRVELTTDAIDLDSPARAERIRFAEIAGIALAHGRLRVERLGKQALTLSSLDAPGALRELADRVALAAHIPS